MVGCTKNRKWRQDILKSPGWQCPIFVLLFVSPYTLVPWLLLLFLVPVLLCLLLRLFLRHLSFLSYLNPAPFCIKVRICFCHFRFRQVCQNWSEALKISQAPATIQYSCRSWSSFCLRKFSAYSIAFFVAAGIIPWMMLWTKEIMASAPEWASVILFFDV